MYKSLMLPTSLFEMLLLYMSIKILHFSGMLAGQLLCTEEHADFQHNLKLSLNQKAVEGFFPTR